MVSCKFEDVCSLTSLFWHVFRREDVATKLAQANHIWSGSCHPRRRAQIIRNESRPDWSPAGKVSTGCAQLRTLGPQRTSSSRHAGLKLASARLSSPGRDRSEGREGSRRQQFAWTQSTREHNADHLLSHPAKTSCSPSNSWSWTSSTGLPSSCDRSARRVQ